jgi:aminomethyltransferase
MLKQTALVDEHKKLGGKMVDFGGWELPVQYSGVLNEHTAVRTACGIFDVSHMGEILVEGDGALEFVNYLVTNDVSTLALHQAQYSALCNSHGGIVDDLVIYRTGEKKYFLVVNASNTDKDFLHIKKIHDAYSGVKPKIENQSAQFSQIAVQGPKAQQILQKLTKTNLSEIKTYWCASGVVDGIETLIARTGYTGEDGFELYMHWNKAAHIWNALLEVGKVDGLIPCGLGARDTLRLEMKYALYGHELTDDTNPLEVGLGWVTKLNKSSDFIGKKPISELKAQGAKKSLVGLKSLGRGIPRQGYEIYAEDRSTLIGQITSGTSSPSLKLPIGVAFIQKTHEAVGTKVFVKVRDDFQECEIVKTPFYSPAKKEHA